MKFLKFILLLNSVWDEINCCQIHVPEALHNMHVDCAIGKQNGLKLYVSGMKASVTLTSNIQWKKILVEVQNTIQSKH